MGLKRIRMLERLGATAVCAMNVSGSDPVGVLRTYGREVLPALRGVTETDAEPLALRGLSTRR